MADKNEYNFSGFNQYLQQGDSNKLERAANWLTAIGLQAVDGLKTSDYLMTTAKQHIEGEIDIDQVCRQLKTYYERKTVRLADDEDMREADLASANIAKILSARTMDFSTEGYIAVHRKIFNGVFKFAGMVRDVDITKREWVLRGDTVNYLNYEDLRRAISFDLSEEQQFDYTGLTMEEIVRHLCVFVSRLWQIHAFREGNTRATAVFAIQYLRHIGFDINNGVFAHHSWYFRNALVRANYMNVQKGIAYDHSFLEKFFRNLLMGEHNELKNRHMIINPPEEWKEPSTVQATIQATIQADDRWHTDNEHIIRLVNAIGNQRLSLKEMLAALNLKHRASLMETYLTPAINGGFVTMLHPDKPKHPRQKYRLSVKGIAVYNEK